MTEEINVIGGEIIRTEPPKVMDDRRIIYWSTELKRLEGVKEGGAIKTKALKFLHLHLVEYNIDTKEFHVKPIPGYNKTTYTIKGEEGHLACNCQFYRKVSLLWEHPICSHSLAVKLYLEIRRWNKQHGE